jgi:hypothetical protein
VTLLIALAIWVTCGAFAYAGALAYFQGSWPRLAKEQYREDLGLAVVMWLGGPFGLVVTTLASGFFKYGLRWK